MKKIGILATGLILMMGNINTSSAATKCVALNESSTCTGRTPLAGKVNWTANCNGIPITGIGICSPTSGMPGETADNVSSGSTTAAIKFCWCKMTSPAVSKWVAVGHLVNQANCYNGCVDSCVGSVTSIASFRAGMFGEMN